MGGPSRGGSEASSVGINGTLHCSGLEVIRLSPPGGTADMTSQDLKGHGHSGNVLTETPPQ